MDSVILNRLQIIKKFYTYLGNIIEMDENNDGDELEFLSEYLDKFDEKYYEWYENYSQYSGDSNDSDETNKHNNSNKSDSTENSEESSADLETFLKLNTEYEEKQSVTEEIPKHLNDFLENINIDNILLYKKNNNPIMRCKNYMNSINFY